MKTAPIKVIIITILTICSFQHAISQGISFSIQRAVPHGNKEGNFPRFSLSVAGGAGYRTDEVSDLVPEDQRDYVERTRLGYVISGDIIYYTAKSFGYGIRANSFTSNTKTDTYRAIKLDGTPYAGEANSEISILFVGPMISFRSIFPAVEKKLYFNVGVGYVEYKGIDVFGRSSNSYTITTTGQTASSFVEVGFESQISKSVSLCFLLSYYSGGLKKLTLNDGVISETFEFENNNQESLRLVNFTIGLRFNK